VKGLSIPVDVYELTGASVMRSRLQGAAARGFTLSTLCRGSYHGRSAGSSFPTH